MSSGLFSKTWWSSSRSTENNIQLFSHAEYSPWWVNWSKHNVSLISGSSSLSHINPEKVQFASKTDILQRNNLCKAVRDWHKRKQRTDISSSPTMICSAPPSASTKKEQHLIYKCGGVGADCWTRMSAGSVTFKRFVVLSTAACHLLP